MQRLPLLLLSMRCIPFLSAVVVCQYLFLFNGFQAKVYLSQVKGQGIYAFVTLVEGVPYSEELRKSLILNVRNQVRPF